MDVDDMEDFFAEEELEDVITLTLLAWVEFYVDHHLRKNVVHNVGFIRNQVVHNMLTDHYRVCFDMCRLHTQSFVRLCCMFRERGLLKDTYNTPIKEQVRIFLQIIGHGHKNWCVQQNLQHSGETISRYFNHVLDAICIWAPEIIKPKESLLSTPDHIINYVGGIF